MPVPVGLVDREVLDAWLAPNLRSGETNVLLARARSALGVLMHPGRSGMDWDDVGEIQSQVIKAVELSADDHEDAKTTVASLLKDKTYRLHESAVVEAHRILGSVPTE